MADAPRRALAAAGELPAELDGPHVPWPHVLCTLATRRRGAATARRADSTCRLPRRHAAPVSPPPVQQLVAHIVAPAAHARPAGPPSCGRPPQPTEHRALHRGARPSPVGGRLEVRRGAVASGHRRGGGAPGSAELPSLQSLGGRPVWPGLVALARRPPFGARAHLLTLSISAAHRQSVCLRDDLQSQTHAACGHVLLFIFCSMCRPSIASRQRHRPSLCALAPALARGSSHVFIIPGMNPRLAPLGRQRHRHRAPMSEMTSSDMIPA